MSTLTLTLAPDLAGTDPAGSATADGAFLPSPVRHAVLEIGDRMRALSESPAPEELAACALRDAVDPGLAWLGREIGFPEPASWRAASRFFHDRFGSLVDASPIAERFYRKPLGYAGDFEMMNMLYRNEALGETPFGRALSRVVLDSPAAQAVRNRLQYLAAKIKAAAERSEPGQPVRILSVAAGPAMELQQILRNDPALLRAGQAEITLLDQDASALGHARERIEGLASRAGVDIALRCLNTSIRTVIADGLSACLRGDDPPHPPRLRHFNGPHNLIYSAGLFDYLKDSTARSAGLRLADALAPGGQALIGNFGLANPTRPFMELLLDWPLIHRTADDLRQLFGGLGTGVTVEQEPAGVNLFAVITR